MSGAATLDLRYPIGGLFVVLGALLAGYGAMTNGDAVMYGRSTGVNVNLWWGLVMLVTGVLFLWLARRGSGPPTRSAEGLATERREEDLGLEKH
ncbi:hypothetical protein [Roseisolibacter sp. H3M3-2]|uniref:hypothetical protein n=1 Tax=Roseisolibacter sp. H3M3-2 TaxID=3031323 RepID=UPI0023DA3CB8|nr:hypothetical protein [Roseisolibacter sp. H3M3-2]MDF1501773.1 hypothetical protein [Roseisolibacter sp. H3M3-2]